MTRSRIATALIALGLSGLAACSSSGGTTAGGGAATSSTAASSASAPVLKTAGSALGTIVVDGQGRTVYYFDKDTPNSGKSACSGPCLQQWPAVTATSSAPAVDGVTGKVGTITRDDGTTQATLNGLPLYLFAGDRKPGDVTGQAFQNVWWVVAPDGGKVTAAPSTSETTPSTSGTTPAY